MANTIEIMLLDNKRAEALVNGYPYALEGNYHIIAGEVNATQFTLKSVPSQYKDCNFTIVGYNAGKEVAKEFDGKIYKQGDTFYLPTGMAKAGYSQLNFSTVAPDGEVVNWLPIKLKIYNTLPNWADVSTSQAEQLQSEIDKLSGNITQTQTDISDIQNGINSLNQNTLKLAQDISGLSSRVETVEDSLQTVETDIDTINEKIQDMGAKPTKLQTISNASGNVSTSAEGENTVVTVTDETITGNSHIELYPSDIATETYFSAALTSNVLEVSAGSFKFTLSEALPDIWQMYYTITETESK